MILGKEFNWYLKIIQTTFLIVGGWVIFFGFIGKIPLVGWAFNLMILPVTWLLKLGGAGYVGYQTVKKHKGTTLQALVSGGIFGTLIGLFSMIISLSKILLRPSLLGLFLGTFDLLSVIFSEALTGLVFGFTGGILAGSPAEKKK